MKWIQYSLEWRRKKYPDKKSDYISRTLGLLPLKNGIERSSNELEMETREQNRNNKRTEME